jgi:hypothetical protein
MKIGKEKINTLRQASWNGPGEIQLDTTGKG